MNHFLRFVCCVLALWVGSLFGQVPDDVITLNYRNGRLQGELPYGKVFAIQGYTHQPGTQQRASAVQLRIYTEAQRSKRIRKQRSLWRRIFQKDKPVPIRFQTAAPSYQSFWWWTPDKDSTYFSFFVDQPLHLDTYYRLELSFYHRYQIHDALTQQIVDSVKRSVFGLMKQEGRQTVRVADINEALNQAILAYTQNINFGYLETTRESGIQFDSLPRNISIPLANFTAETGLTIGRIIQEEQILADLEIKIDTLGAGTAKLLSQEPQVQDLLTRLDRAYRQMQLGSGPVGFDRLSLEALQQFVSQASVAVDPFPDLIAYASGPNGQDFLEANDLGLLRGLKRNYFTPLQTLIEARRRSQQRIASLNALLDRQDLDQVIAEGFVEANSASLIQTPFSPPVSDDKGGSNQRVDGSFAPATGYNAINIGTAYGVGLVGLNFPNLFNAGENAFAQTEPALITYLGGKFYFNKVDRARFIQNPYPLLRDRFSLLLGIRATGQLNYRGQPYQNVIGVQPVGGICFDLNRTLSLDLGIIAFSAPSISPLNDTQQLRIAPFFGLSIDANAFNFVRNSINSANIPTN